MLVEMKVWAGPVSISSQKDQIFTITENKWMAMSSGMMKMKSCTALRER